MQFVGQLLVCLVVGCAVIGALAAVRDDSRGLGREFMEGLRAIGPIFVPVAGVMASIPFLAGAVDRGLGPLFTAIGADPALAVTAVIAVDMGGYHLAGRLAESPEGWIMAAVVGYMAGATIVFSIPVGLAMLRRDDHRYLALGVMAGILSVPIGVLITWTLLAATGPVAAGGAPGFPDSAYRLHITPAAIAANAAPLVGFVVLLALGLRFVPEVMIRLFIAFGRVMDAGIKLVLVASIVEASTTGFFGIGEHGLLGAALGGWGLDPIIADTADTMRALEVAGYIGMMLAGAFPMVHLLRRHLRVPIQALGRRLGMAPIGAAGLLASVANILAMFRLVADMPPRDKVVNIAFAVCAAFLFGDHLAFTANFQPTLMLPILVGKVGGGLAGIGLAFWLAVGRAERL